MSPVQNVTYLSGRTVISLSGRHLHHHCVSVLKANRDFHTAIAQGSGNPRLAAMVSNISTNVPSCFILALAAGT
ncbi:FCD domain-containing protein [Rhizobium sp. Root482]|uniref:FCD domain-containing protein n=1 Tax=Rhizobium sp. Root482 TaxID=1736543 RepID=UPI0039B732CD